jgi:hypothetical protein
MALVVRRRQLVEMLTAERPGAITSRSLRCHKLSVTYSFGENL